MKKRTEKKQMRYTLMAVAAITLFVMAVVLLENNLASISTSALLAIAGTVGVFYAGMNNAIFDAFFLDKLWNGSVGIDSVNGI